MSSIENLADMDLRSRFCSFLRQLRKVNPYGFVRSGIALSRITVSRLGVTVLSLFVFVIYFVMYCSCIGVKEERYNGVPPMPRTAWSLHVCETSNAHSNPNNTRVNALWFRWMPSPTRNLGETSPPGVIPLFLSMKSRDERCRLDFDKYSSDPSTSTRDRVHETPWCIGNLGRPQMVLRSQSSVCRFGVLIAAHNFTRLSRVKTINSSRCENTVTEYVMVDRPIATAK